MIAARIKMLREKNGMTQTELARALGVTRSSVNAWELEISNPSTHYIVEMAQLFRISTDYLLGCNTNTMVNVSGLDDKDMQIVYALVKHLRER